MSASPQAGARLRRLVVAAGVCAAALFVVVGLAFRLQTYGDGSIFSYAVATREVWAFHWHNIPTRAATWALTMAPAEALVARGGDPQAGVFLYGLLFFAAPAVSLAACFALDRAPGRPFFVFACASASLLAPLVFGFTTEMWVAHALFWPAFACAMTWRSNAATPALLALTIALVLSHEGGLVLAFGIVVATALGGLRGARFLRALGCFACALAIWLGINHFLRPDPYFGEVRLRAASEFFETKIFVSPILVLIVATLAAYGGLATLLSRLAPRAGIAAATLAVAIALAVWWLWFDRSLHADHRYYLRTILLIGACGFAAVAGLMQLCDEGGLVARIAPLSRVIETLRGDACARVLPGAVALVALIHVVEAAKFVRGFERYRAAVRALALGADSDPTPGAPFLVSSQRIDADLNRLSWFSTTPYLSALVADFAPIRLVVDPAGTYFWLSCATAREAAEAPRAVPQKTREMIRIYSCLHRP